MHELFSMMMEFQVNQLLAVISSGCCSELSGRRH
jgi:hypothetical protein